MSKSFEEVDTAVGLISGGLDSAVVASYMANHYAENYFVFCDYGQKTLDRERRAFREICARLEPAAAHEVDLTFLARIGGSALFEEDTVLTSANRKREYVPFRNAILLSAATALAETVEAGHVLVGSTGGDTTCPDNSPAFISAFSALIREGTMTDRPIKVVAPLVELSKTGVIQLGFDVDAPFELSWSCHNNSSDVACGQCSNCESRRTAFIELGHEDPIKYESA